MNLAIYEFEQQRFAGLVNGTEVRPLIELNQSAAPFYDLLAGWNEELTEIELVGADSVPIALPDVALLAPVVAPRKIICVGRNYAQHAAEMGSQVGDIPVIFNKLSNALANPDEDIQIPSISQAVDYEAELVVVIGREGKNIPQDQAMDYVFGYCCGNDVSARDWQKGKPGGQWLLGKSFDSFAPIGPWIVTKDQVDPAHLDVSLKLNGNLMQRANTSELIFPIDFLIAHLSKFMTLYPGDLLFSGTPEGVGAGRKPPVFLKPGDETVVEISGLGELRNQFVAGN